jgi:flagellar basal body-associated protein FliL
MRSEIMSKLTILLIVIVIMAAGVTGYIFGSQNSQSVPITLINNTTDDDSGSSPSELTKTRKNTTKLKTNTTVKKNTTATNTTTNSTSETNGTNSTP